MGSDIIFAFMLTLLAGLATGVGGFIGIFFKRTNLKFLSLALAFSAGVMLFISFVEMFDEAKESFEYAFGYDNALLFAVIAFFGGAAIIAIIDKLIPHHDDDEHAFDTPSMSKEEKNAADAPKDAKSLNRTGIMSAVAVAIHNFPEGLVTFMAAMVDPALGVVIAVAIAIHNIPEGMAISAPVYFATGNKKKALALAIGSGLAEPLGALAAFFALYHLLGDAMLGITFAAVGGMMVFISLHQLLPAANKYGEHHHIIKGLFAGMIVMALSLVILQ